MKSERLFDEAGQTEADYCQDSDAGRD
jgi:hypothetical protein